MPSLDVGFLNLLKENYKDYSVFIESGTGAGNTILALEPEFQKLYTIEITEKYHNLTKDKYKGSKINFYKGESHKLFPSILPTIKEKSIFFLDGHYSSGDTGKGEKDCPLLEELTEINNLFKQDAIIIIDNFRLFGKGPATGLNEDWTNISKDKIIDIMKNRITQIYHLKNRFFENDRIIIHIRKQYHAPEKNTIKGVVCLIYGGLGNQLFQAVAGYLVHKTHKHTIYLLKNTVCKHNSKNFNYYDIFLKSFGQQLDITYINFLDFVNKEYTILSPKTPYSDWNMISAENGTLLCGFYQYYPSIRPYENDIRKIVLSSLEPYRQVLQQRINFNDRVFLHVRRGDYVNNKYHKQNGIENYYKKAVEMFKDVIHDKIIVVTDDTKWVTNEPFFQTGEFSIFNGDEIETLALMSLCTAGAICANSTYSWWGAFLGAYAKRNKVIVPKAWANDDASNLIPSEWTSI